MFQQIVGSSIWSTPNHVRIAWVTMLATADRRGISALTVGGLSALARISREEAEDAFNVLSAPDADTLTQENEGRRIIRVEDGWKLLNWEKYREKAKRAIIQESNREAQAKWREKQNPPDEPTAEDQPELDAVNEPPDWNPTELQLRLGALFKRRPTTQWSKDELKAFKSIGRVASEDLRLLEAYYTATFPQDKDYRRRDLSTLLNNLNGEIDRARQYKPPECF